MIRQIYIVIVYGGKIWWEHEHLWKWNVFSFFLCLKGINNTSQQVFIYVCYNLNFKRYLLLYELFKWAYMLPLMSPNISY